VTNCPKCRSLVDADRALMDRRMAFGMKLIHLALEDEELTDLLDGMEVLLVPMERLGREEESA
jgi:hypothetical protein